MDLKDTYNKIAKDWHKDHQKDEWWVVGTDKFVSLLAENDLVLDVGCGAGTKSKYLIGKGLEVVGIDFSKEMIKIAKKEVPAGRFMVLDLDDIENLKETFDGIFMQAVLLHIPKKKIIPVLEKVAKKLKKGGYLYIAVKEKRKNGQEEEVVLENDYGYEYERFFSYFSKDEIIGYMKEIGLKIVHEAVTDLGNTNWIQVIGKK
ncbi:MAG: hypothetical protein UX02_C0002G0134 [Candidatus Moranbacteria bacterium GW2011_GWC1_45_18]|nr:MAG: Methyltransferase type 11 [Candidatus Moranbacteria bacterium GW2011_GWC2_40_12]KKT33915.1 MAG: Methyltransferase type 11 [Candidatus Moranbacteria bacterium GW2011_GWF2_44_10]KKT70231.1 MAG: Methyltransferase type 11 [Candidatus Moranbacteria bacterium GW2011_GWF1_44_4]KKT99815.1 MAG: hypothetical protein UX02_C0002G0134 [Candidatus Moranbacteria bacterium GW2011_GWC1_45_18]OGI24716.1 MAG: hypothetical protein A2194_01680 [Candidatus Moranbacteria bacterium RIFOXYA1_FULL_44_8]OGI34993